MRRSWSIALAAAAVGIVAVLALGACTGDGGPGVASAGGTPTASPGGGRDPAAQELEFVRCMRNEGIADMPDPVPEDTSGRSAVRYALDVMGKGSDDAFQAALDACMNLLPAVTPPEPPSPDDLDAYQAFAQCMRDNGVAEFPDHDPNEPRYMFVQPEGGSAAGEIAGVTNVDGFVVLNLGDPGVAAAFDACKTALPNNDD